MGGIYLGLSGWIAGVVLVFAGLKHHFEVDRIGRASESNFGCVEVA